MIVQNLPRVGGKTTALIKHMTAPGNESVLYVSATEQQADNAWRLAKTFDPTIRRDRFLNPRKLLGVPGHSVPKRLVIDDANETLDQLLNARIEMIALTGENQK